MIIFHWINSLWYPESGEGYAIGSSWAGVNLGMFSVWYVLYKRHNCHEPRCHRVGRKVVVTDGHHELFCRKHAPPKPGDNGK